MNLSRKKEIRSMVRDIPEMIRSGFINQAFEAEKIIASTFDFSDDFLEKLGGIPQNYIERMQDIYSDLLQRAFNSGFKTAEVKLKAIQIDFSLPEREVNRELELKIPMPYGTKQDIVNTFREEIKAFLESIPCGEEQLSLQFNKDLEAAFKDGVKEYVREIPAKNQEPAREPIQEPAFAEVKDVEAKLILNVWDKFATPKLRDIFESNFENARHRVNAKMVKNFADWMTTGKKARDFFPKEKTKTATADISKETLDHLEKYVKLLGSGEAEKVLRFVVGLGTGVKKAKKKKKTEKTEKAEASVVAKKKEEKEDKKEDKKDKKEDKKDKKEGKEEKGVKNNTATTIKKLEEYTKLLNNPLAEKVLRYTLGLPPKAATASFKSIGRQIGFYDTQVLKQRILELLRSHNMNTDDDFQTIVIECITPGVLEMDEQEASKSVAQKLGFEGPLTLGEVEDRADSLASELDVSLGLPGDLVFLITDEGDFCLTYNFNRKDIVDLDIEQEKEEFEETEIDEVEEDETYETYEAEDETYDIDMEDELPEEDNEEDEYEIELDDELDDEIDDEIEEEDEEDEENQKVTSSLPILPLAIDQQQGAFSKKEQEEIAELLRLGKSKTYKDIKKASPTMAEYISDVLARIRNGKLSLTEGANILKSNIEDLISDCFGTEGQGYFQYLKNKGMFR